MPETRKFVRYRVSAPVVFWWKHNDDTFSAEGICRDISVSGVFIWSDICPPDNSSLWCEIYLPSLGASSQNYRVEVSGSVKRTDPPSQRHSKIGFAVSSSKIMLFDDEAYEYLEKAGTDSSSRG